MGILDLTSRALEWVITQAKKDYQDYNTRRLIEQAYSDRPSVSIFARAKLKKDYPDIFAELEASKWDKRETTNQDSSKSPTPSGEKSNDPLPMGELYSKQDEDFHEYKRGFKF
jgi:hypothetical protein